MHLWRLTTLTLLFTFVFLAIAGKAQAKTNCWDSDWVKSPRTEDSQYRYYVGVASGDKKERERTLIDHATQNARDTAIAENFGILTAIQKQSYQSLSSATSLKRISETSKQVIVKEFRRKDTCWQFQGKRKTLWLLFKYPKVEINKELKRIEKTKFVNTSHSFNEVSATSKRGSGILEVVTSPLGMSISVGESHGKTPIKVRLTPGPHKFILDDPYFKAREEKVIIAEGKTQRINKMMERAKRKIQINTLPQGAEVSLAGKYLGLSPIDTRVLTGENLALKITHPETQPYRTDIKMGKGPDDFILDNIKLAFKPSYLFVKSLPQGADVYLDGNFVGKTPTKFFEIRNGRRNVVLKKKNYLDHKTHITLKGGERKILETIKLTSFTEREIRLRDFPWFFGFDIHPTNTQFVNEDFNKINSYGFGLFAEKRFHGYIGVQGKVGYNLGNKDELDLSGFTVEASVPVHLHEYIVLSPLIGYFDGTLKESRQGQEEQESDNSANPNPNPLANLTASIPTFYYGGRIGLELGGGAPSAVNVSSRNNYTRRAMSVWVGMIKYQDDRFLKQSFQFGFSFKFKLFATPILTGISEATEAGIEGGTGANFSSEEGGSEDSNTSSHTEEAAAAEGETETSRIPSAVTPAKAKYAIQIASYPQETDAALKAETYRDRGLEAFYLPAEIKGQKWFRVYIGSFGSTSEAKEYNRQLIRQSGIKGGFVKRISH